MKTNIKRVWHPYTQWEDYKNGMWSTVKGKNRKVLLKKSYELAVNADLFDEWWDMKNESELLKLIQTTALKYNCVLYRNNQGAFRDKTGRFIFFGLGNISKKLSENWKTSDLIGYTKVKITQDMVGREIAVFTAIEVKLPDAKIDARYRAQEKFINQVKREGGIALMCNSKEYLERMFKEWKK